MANTLDSIHVFYTRGDRGNETVVEFGFSAGKTPLVCLNARNLEFCRRIAQNYAAKHNCRVVMKRFVGDTIVEEMEP